jgi:hypothetical protein
VTLIHTACPKHTRKKKIKRPEEPTVQSNYDGKRGKQCTRMRMLGRWALLPPTGELTLLSELKRIGRKEGKKKKKKKQFEKVGYLAWAFSTGCGCIGQQLDE